MRLTRGRNDCTVRASMSQIETLAAEIRRLPKAQARELHDWLADYVEDQETLAPDFVQRIEEGRRDLAAGRVRVGARTEK